eukprot:72392_1
MSCLFAFIIVLFISTKSAKDFSYYNSTGPYKIKTATLKDGYPIWYPTSTAELPNLPIYLFVCGTGAHPNQYKETLELVATHGFVSVGSWMEGKKDGRHAIKYIESGDANWPNEIKTPNISNVATGGHSGGGPVALYAATGGSDFNPQNEPYIQGYISQHGAAIPGVNTPSKKQIQDVGAPLMALCGSHDSMPYCGCHDATKHYYDNCAANQGRILVTAPDTHNGGTMGKSGRDLEGGFVVAFLSYTLQQDQDAKQALANFKENGYSVEDQL